MLKITKKDKTKLELEIEEVLNELSETDKTSDSYELLLDRLKTLHGLNSDERKWTVSQDTVAIIAGNLLGIGLILNYEKLNIVTSKALGFVIKGRA